MATLSYQEIAGIPRQVPRVGRGHFMAGQGLRLAACQPEVVFVFEQFSLIDAESYQRNYSRKSGHALARGYYVVTWPSGRGCHTFGDEALFHGPYPSRKEAEASLAKPRAALPPDIQDARNRAAIALEATRSVSQDRMDSQRA